MSEKQFYVIVLAIFIHIAIWFQLNGQLIWKWFKDNPLLLSLLGVPISYAWLRFTAIAYESYGELWAVRLIGFATGMISFPIMTWLLFNEGITLKTAVSILLSCVIMILQFI